jgi:hypothetical protein
LSREAVDRVFDRRVLPVVHVVRLIAARDEERFGVFDRLQGERVERGGLVLQDQRLDGVEVPEVEYILVVAVGAGRADDREVSTAGRDCSSM